MSIHRVESAQSRPVIFDDPPNAAGDAATSQKLQDDIFGADPWRQLARELYAQNSWHGDRVRFSRHSQRNIEAAGADREHAQRACGRRVTVRTEKGFAGAAEALHVHDMANPIPGGEYQSPNFRQALSRKR